MASSTKSHRGRHAGTIEELPSGRFRARLRVVYPDGTHKRLTGKSVRTRKEAQADLDQFSQDAKYNVRPVSERLTVATMIQEHIAGKEATWAKRTLHNNQTLYRQHIQFNLGDKYAAGLAPKDLQRYFAGLSAGGLGYSGQRQVHSLLSGAYKRAIADGALRENPTLHARPLSPSKGGKAAAAKVKHFAPEELGRFIDFALLERGGLLLAFIACTGLRIGEAVALTWGDFEEDEDAAGASFISVTKTRGDIGGKIHTGPVKTAAGRRRLPLSADACRIVLDMRRRVSLEMLGDQYKGAKVIEGDKERTVKGTDKDAPLLPTVSGDFMRDDVARGVMDRICEAAGLPLLSPHALRHSFGTYLISAGHDPVSVSKYMGHAQTSTTLNIYAHAVPDKLRGLGINRAALTKEPAKGEAAPRPKRAKK